MVFRTHFNLVSFFRALKRIVSAQSAVILAVAVLVLLPAYNLLYNSFTSLGFGVHSGFTLRNYVTAFNDPLFGQLFFNSFVYALSTALLAVGTAIILAWIVTRTDTPLRGIGEFVPIVPLLFPPVLGTISWVYLLAPRSGIVNGVLSDIFGTPITLVNAYSLLGMIWVLGLASIPMAYLLLVPAFTMLDPSLEEAAKMAGASTTRTMFKVTLPLAFPSIFTAFLLLLVHGLGAFETAVLLGIPAGYPVFVSRIYDAVQLEYNPGLGTAYSGILLAITVSLVSLYILITRRSEKYATVVGKGYSPRVIKLGRWRYVTLLFMIGYALVAIVIPFGVTSVTSLLPYFTYDVFKNFLNNITLQNYAALARVPTMARAFTNSFILGFSAAVIVVPLCAIIAYITSRGRGRGRKSLEFLSTLPIGFPGIILGLGLLWTYFGTPVYNTIWGMLIAYVIVFIPFTLRLLSATIIRIHREHEEAARIHGGSWAYSFRRILLPLMKAGLASGFFYVFINAQRFLGEVILLSGPGLEVAPTLVFNYYNVGQWGPTAAVSLIFAALLLIYVIVAKYLLGINFTVRS